MLESSIENRLEMPPTIQKRQMQFAFINEKSHNFKLLLLLMLRMLYAPFCFYAAENAKRHSVSMFKTRYSTVLLIFVYRLGMKYE